MHNASETAKRNLLYQYFFMNYLISICLSDVLSNSNQEMTRPISQKIYIILIKLLEALSDKELN